MRMLVAATLGMSGFSLSNNAIAQTSPSGEAKPEAKPDAALPPPAETVAQTGPRQPTGVFVHIDTPRPVELQYEGDDPWHEFHTVCASPCDTEVPADANYRISGRDVNSSGRFSLLEGPTRQTVVTAPHSAFAFYSGIGLVVVGAPAIVFAFLGLTLSNLGENPEGGPPPDMKLPKVAGIAGVTSVAIGMVLILLHPPAHVTVTGRPAPAVIDRPWRSAGELREPQRLIAPTTMSTAILTAAF
jgi:hypothetical protein